jgi:hypothetical protein
MFILVLDNQAFLNRFGEANAFFPPLIPPALPSFRWKSWKVGMLLLISLIPFGNFYVDKHYLQGE